MSNTGSLGWDASSGKIYWSEETYNIFECDRTIKPTLELVLHRVHPDDRSAVEQLIELVSRERAQFDFEHRLLMPDGSVNYLPIVGRPSGTQPSCFEFVGTATDITQRQRPEEWIR